MGTQVKVRFTKDHNGYVAGETLECDPGIADAFVEWARAAEYVTGEVPPPPVMEKVVDAPPADKMIRRGRPPGSKNKFATK